MEYQHDTHCNAFRSSPVGCPGCSCYAHRAGFYWVRFCERWVVAELKFNGEWFLPGSSEPWNISDFRETGAKIQSPE